MHETNDKDIVISQPLLPDLDQFTDMLKDIWASHRLTNSGPYHQALEAALCRHLGVEHISLYANGTLALLAALRILDIQGEVITTPYTFIATTNVLLWQHLKPVFVDINPDTFNLDPDQITQAITSKTQAILPVHCYGIPCDVNAISNIAKANQLRLLYDGAHAFGVKDKQGASIFNHGDLSVISFHATKLFSTIEGGAIICPDKATKEKADRIKNFGLSNETTLSDIGINAKLSEIHAAFGLLQLESINDEINKRRQIALQYVEGLADIKEIRLPGACYFESTNFSYFPIVIQSNGVHNRDELHAFLQSHHIITRRYFYPLVNHFDLYKTQLSSVSTNLPVAMQISSSILCLPIHSQLTREDIHKILNVIRQFFARVC